ncbi:phosphoglycerate kinase, partial [Candidatus Wolfebacteria bacterium]|nr:phosphoglycerate kinase [Candidatus Wolfebacteria bacterium]
MKYLSSLKNKNLSNQICLLRVDFNLTDDDLRKQKIPLRIKSALPTIKFLLGKGAKVVILSHRGRPKEASDKQQATRVYTLKPFVKILSKLLKKSVQFIDFKKDFKTIKTIIKISPRG